MLNSLVFNSSGQGEPLVFIHGWGLNSAIWQPVVAKLAQQYQVITIDLPGFGENVEQSITPYSLAHICSLINNSISQPAIYIGWSLGGLVATQMALSFPEKVQGVVTVASSPYFIEQTSNTNSQKWFGIKPQVLATFHQQLEDNIEKTLDGFLKIQAMGSPHLRQDIKQMKTLVMQYPIPSKQTLADSLALLASSDLRGSLKQINQPFLRLYGKLDSLVPKAAIELINQLAPQSACYIFDKASHAPFISHLDEFIEQLTQWLVEHK